MMMSLLSVAVTVGVPDALLDGDHVEALHHGLQRVDRVDLATVTCAPSFHRLRTASLPTSP